MMEPGRGPGSITTSAPQGVRKGSGLSFFLVSVTLSEGKIGRFPFPGSGVRLWAMPRLARTVFAGIPHHVTQRGNRREQVFFKDADRQIYLEWLESYAVRYELLILAWCLMTNHDHLLAVPAEPDGLQSVFKPLHTRYAQYIDRESGWSGHLWQGRFFSSPLDEAYLRLCVRYVERNPVRAGMVERAEDYRWSSARGHCGLADDGLVSSLSNHWKSFQGIENWVAWLAEEEDAERLDIVRRNVQTNLPCGSDAFVIGLERVAGRNLQCRPQGRPRKE